MKICLLKIRKKLCHCVIPANTKVTKLSARNIACYLGEHCYGNHAFCMCTFKTDNWPTEYHFARALFGNHDNKIHLLVRPGAMPRLAENLRQRALGMLQAGFSQRRVAGLLRCHPSTILRLRRRFANTGNVLDRPRAGRPRVTTPVQDANILNSHRQNRFRTSAETARRTQGLHG